MRKHHNTPNDKPDTDKNSTTGNSTSKNKPRRFSLPKRKPKQDIINLDNVRSQSVKYKKEKTHVELIPRNTAQEDYIGQLNNNDNKIIFAIGPAGTGKTMMAVLTAIKSLKDRKINRIIVTRPAVSVENEDHGFLPGDLNQKMEPWLLPVFDIFNEYWSTIDINNMIEDKIIEICPLMYMRGRSFSNCLIIADEMQNSTPNQMKMLLTRLGDNTRLFVTGDINQHDANYANNGLRDIMDRIHDAPSTMIAQTIFENKHIERSEIVRSVLRLYGE